MTLSIIIVSFNTATILKECLSYLYRALHRARVTKHTEVIIVDNASADSSVPMVKKDFPHVRLLVNKENYGFAKANNQGARIAEGRYLLLLNSDTIVTEDFFLSLFAKFKNKPQGVMGTRLLNTDKTVQPSVGFFPTLIRVFLWMMFLDDIPVFRRLIPSYHIEDTDFYRNSHSVDWVSGACVWVPKKLVNEVGLFDEKIFMYGEEVEWCYRVKAQGYKVWYEADIEIIHKKGASGKGHKAGILEEFLFLLYFYRKHKPKWQYPILFLLLKLGALLRIIVFGIIRKYPDRIDLYAQAFRMHV